MTIEKSLTLLFTLGLSLGLVWQSRM